MTQSLPSLIWIALKHLYSSPVQKLSILKELLSSTPVILFHTIAFPTRSSWTEMSASHLNLPQNSAVSSTSIRISVQHITLRWMELVKEPIKPLSNICKSSVAPNKTTSMNGSHSHSIPRTLGYQQLQRKHHLIYSSDICHKFTNLSEKQMYLY
jgi:hypothetical protein